MATNPRSTPAAGSAAPATEQAGDDESAYTPDDPWRGWDKLSVAAKLERLVLVVRRLDTAGRVP